MSGSSRRPVSQNHTKLSRVFGEETLPSHLCVRVSMVMAVAAAMLVMMTMTVMVIMIMRVRVLPHGSLHSGLLSLAVLLLNTLLVVISSLLHTSDHAH